MFNKRLSSKLIAFFVLIFMLFCEKINVKAITLGNCYPIILVSGMGGYERDKLLGFKYYGGINDIQQILTRKGYKTYSAFSSPFSSDWDQACELFAYIKGGTVDYGAAHSKKYGHDRYGETYPGIYPNWDGINKVHFVGFSTGATSTRLLDEFLRSGDLEEQTYYSQHQEEGISPLFQGIGQSFIHSITSLGTSHNGSLAFEEYSRYPTTVKDLILNVAVLAENTGISPNLYDFKLGQWGLKRMEGEPTASYANRVYESNVWQSPDTVFYTITRQGAEELNSRTSAHNNMYYFSYSADCTYKGNDGIYYPLASTNIIARPGAAIIGQTTDPTLQYGYEAWRPSDGAASVISARYPFGQPFQDFNGNIKSIKRGVWNAYPTLKGWDHIDLIGLFHPADFAAIEYLYTNMARTLRSLPK